jgi:hypothetical protein
MKFLFENKDLYNTKYRGFIHGVEMSGHDCLIKTDDSALFDILSNDELDCYVFTEMTDENILATESFPSKKFIYFGSSKDLAGNYTLIETEDKSHPNFIPFLCDLNLLNGKKRPLYQTEILIINNKPQFPDHWIMSWATKYRIKVFGNTKANVPNYLGKLSSNNDYANALASANILLMKDDSYYLNALYNDCVPLVINNIKDLEKRVSDMGGNFLYHLLKLKNSVDMKNFSYQQFANRFIEEKLNAGRN